jgi:hypothetical protein
VNGSTSSASRPSPALVIAVIALVAAFATSAIAADPPTRKITKSKVKQIAVKQINKLAPGLAVASAQTAGTAGSADNVLWAVVDNGPGANDATLARAGQPGTTVAEPASPAVNVDFGRPVTDCAWIATKGAVANATPAGGEITTEGVGANPNAVQVRVRSSAGGPAQSSFHLQVVC